MKQKNLGSIIFIVGVVIDTIVFLPNWLSIYWIPLYLAVHFIVWFSILKIRRLESSLSAWTFAVLTSMVPFGITFISGITIGILLYMTKSAYLLDLFLVGMSMFLVCGVGGLINWFLYNQWLRRKIV